jgi:two-component sensor histidine kinase
MKRVRNKTIVSYAYALGILVAAIFARRLIDFVLPGELAFITFFPAVFLAAYFFGRGPGILVLVLSTIVGTLWLDPTGQSSVSIYLASALLFFTIAGMIVFLVHELKAARDRLRQHEKQLEMINLELKHRIKNLFSITDSICQQTINAGGTAKEMSRAVSGRILAIASAQDWLSATATEGGALDDLVRELVQSLAPSPSRMRIEGNPIRLPVDSTTPMALILHELATNALKYGAWSKDAGWVHVKWTANSEHLLIVWREHDGPRLAPPIREGLGRKLIKTSLPGARVDHSFNPDGLECRIELPTGR